MASEVIKLNLIPKGEMPVFHASQFDTGRLITCELYRGEDAYSVPEGYTVELHCRKVDNNIVTMTSTLINDNVVTFTSTEQLTACNGNNLCEVAILDEGYRIGTLNFILEVEIDPLKGGITSTSEIHNLETQVEEITTEIVGENYYNKTEVDDLLDTKADASSVYTKTQVDSALTLKANTADVYTKSQTDTLLSAKANSSDVYTKGQVDTALAEKADVSDLPDMDLYYTKTATDTLLAVKADASTTTEALATKADKSDTYTKEQVDTLIYNIFPVKTASGTIANFSTGLTFPLVAVTAAEGATAVTRCGVNLFDLEKFLTDNGVTYTKDSDWVSFTPTTPLYMNHYKMPITSAKSLLLMIDTDNTTATNFRVRAYDNTDAYEASTVSGNPESTTLENKTMGYIGFDWSTVGTIKCKICIIDGATAPTAYSPYNGQTVPIADATTLTTLSGVNNVFTDVGDVTVQYKYLSI